MENSRSSFSKTVRISELPSADCTVFRDTSFFRSYDHDLPSADEVRAKGLELWGSESLLPTPKPVLFEEFDLVVKYGTDILIAEGQCLWYFNRHMKDHVPTPEVYGWQVDGGQTFLYMQFVHGETLADVWPSMREEDRDAICEELHQCVAAWRELRQESEPYYIGHIARQGVGDIIFSDQGDANPGPFPDIGAFHDHFSRIGRKNPELNPRRDIPEIAGLTDARPVVFTHGDLQRCNIIVALMNGSNAEEADDKKVEERRPRFRLAAIIDFHQSGWYPADWEWLKAFWGCDPHPGGGRDTNWLDKVVMPADKAYLMAWEYITMSVM